jgi:type IV pilus assembly protein PilV
MLILSNSRPSTQLGAGLIEVMISLLLLGVGLLGIMSMQTRSLNLNQQAYLSSQATSLIRDMSDRMRANSTAANDYLFNYGSSVPTAADCTSANCSESQLAEWDVSQWLGSVQALLPQGDAEIIAQGDGYLISVEFDLDQGEENELTEVSVRVQL